MQEFILPILTSTALTTIITWLLARSKYKRELKALDLDNEIKSAAYYQSLLDDMSSRLEKAIQELMKSEELNRELMQTNRKLVAELQKQRKS